MNKSRHITTFNKKERKVEVRYIDEWEEYQCFLFIEGSLHNNSTYFTNSKEDAMLTAKEMVK